MTEKNDRILIVDDDPFSCELLFDLLESEGYTNLTVAKDGPEALQNVASEPPSLIFLDVMMPGMSGFEVCQKLKDDPQTAAIPIVMVTALTDRNTRLEGLKLGANDFLTKPVDEAELLARTRSLLRSKGMHDALRDLARERIEFVGQVSHELRTPLFAITGLTEMLLDGEVTQPERVQGYLRTIYEQSGYLTRIVDDLLDLSHFESGRIRLECQTFRLAPFLEDTLTLMSPRAAGQTITIQSEPVSPDLMICADEGRLRQVIINLISNALRYNDPGGWVRISADQERDRVVIRVFDSGWGIPKQDLPQIFKRFYRGEKAQTESEKHGAGLGLALAQEIIRAHGGEINVQSEGLPKRGSVFEIILPREVHDG